MILLLMAAAASTLIAPPSQQSNILMLQTPIASDSCVAPAAGSFADTFVSVGLNVGRLDKDCEVRKEARIMAEMGYPQAGIRVLCMIPRIELAMALAGTPCEGVHAPPLPPATPKRP